LRVLIDIGHPAHVHYFRNLALYFINKGDKVLFTCRDKEIVLRLLKSYGFNYVNIGNPYKSILGKVAGIPIFCHKLVKISESFKPDLLLSAGSIYAAHASLILHKPHIALEDTFNFEQIWLYKPFTDAIITSDYEHPLKSKKVVRYSGYHELGYLHPTRFNPDISVLDDLEVDKGEKYVIMRFVSWNASHDLGHTGVTIENKINAIKTFKKYAKIFVSSENELPDEISSYKINIPPDKMHDAIAFASLVFGESSTMSEEAAMLGVPSIYLYNNSTYYSKHLEYDFELMFNYSESEEDQLSAIRMGEELLLTPDIKDEWLIRRNRMLVNKIDVTGFLIWFVENWPDSFRIMKENPDYQKKFR